MIVTEIGNYRVLKDFTTRGSISVGTIPAGTVIRITSIDRQYRKVIGPSLFDWIHWELPVEPINGEAHP